MSGYVLIHRTLIGHPSFRNDAEAMAFAWMICRAAWKASRVRYKGHAVSLQRGELAISQRDMAQALDRDKAWVERLWKRLVAEAMIAVRREAASAVITICNYDNFQPNPETREAVPEAEDEADARQTQGTEQIREEYNNTSEPKGSSGDKRARRLPANWHPEKPLPANVAALVAQWPPGRMERELDGFVDFWTSRAKDAARTDWDKVWHNRIRDQHDRIIRENRYGTARKSDTPEARRGSRPDPAFDLWREAQAEYAAEDSDSDQAFGERTWPALPSFGAS